MTTPRQHQGAEKSAPFFSSLPSPLGEIVLCCDGEGKTLLGLWFAGQRHDGGENAVLGNWRAFPVLRQTRQWLAEYFAGKAPAPAAIPLAPQGTPFRQSVWALLRAIPYGRTATYGAIAAELEYRTGKRVSARAVGSAVGHNPISLLIPCHRVIGAGGNLTGYAGGLERKRFLLKLESGNGTGAAV